MSSVAVDLNLSQSALLELKLAAIKHLSYEDYLLLLGENEDPHNQRYVAYTIGSGTGGGTRGTCPPLGKNLPFSAPPFKLSGIVTFLTPF